MRVCARGGCGRSIDHLRVDAEYCSNSCRLDDRRDLDHAVRQSVFWSSLADIRRSRPAVRAGRARRAESATETARSAA
jgi:hypothetical protein